MNNPKKTTPLYFRVVIFIILITTLLLSIGWLFADKTPEPTISILTQIMALMMFWRFEW